VFSECFARPLWLILLPLALLGLWYWRPTATGASRTRRWLIGGLRLCAVFSLTLVLAGFRIPGNRTAFQFIAVVDLSASVYDRAAQQAALKEIASVLAGSEHEFGVVVFGKSPALERPLTRVPVPPPARERFPAEGTPKPTNPDAALPPLPDLLHPRAVIDPNASDIGQGFSFGRGIFHTESTGPRALILLSDGLDTAGHARTSAASLEGSGVDLLALPAALSVNADVRIASVRLPEHARVGLGTPVQVTVEGRAPAVVRVQAGRIMGTHRHPLEPRDLTLSGSLDGPDQSFSGTVTLVDDPPDAPGLAIYEVRIEGRDGDLPGDYKRNNLLRAAVRVAGPSRWAVLTHAGSTLATWAADAKRPLGVECELFTPERAPSSPDAYREFSGVLVDGLSAQELPPGSAALSALEGAMRDGLPLIAVGGPTAFGAGEHPQGGTWERLLPVTLRPEDDRTRALLFLVDISASMSEDFGGKRKLDFAKGELGQVANLLRPTDRVGLIAFSGAAHLVAPLSNESGRMGFRSALNKLDIERQTDFLRVLDLARETLDKDDAEQQLAFLVSDGEPEPMQNDTDLGEAARKLCPLAQAANQPRRRLLHTFGIGTAATDEHANRERMKLMAREGGGTYFPEFAHLAKSLQKFIEEDRKDLFTRRENVGLRPVATHPVLGRPDQAWPVVPFRNRVEARPESTVLLQSVPGKDATTRGSRKPDPILVLGHFGAAKTAALALSLDAPDGQSFLAGTPGWPGGQLLLARLLAWTEERDAARAGWRVETDVTQDETIRVRVWAEDPASNAPRLDLKLTLRFSSLEAGSDAQFDRKEDLRPTAPGRYEAEIPAPPEGVYRLEVFEQGAPVMERFVTVPFPRELQRFGTDRAELAEYVRLAGGRSRVLNVPSTDLAEWIRDTGSVRVYYEPREVLLALAALFFLASIASRALKSR